MRTIALNLNHKCSCGGSIHNLDMDAVNKLESGVKAIALPDERWGHVDIKQRI